jgi:hypothetical protein
VIIDGPAETPREGTNAPSRPKNKLSTEAQRASALSAKTKRGRVKYYASSRNQANARPLEVGGTTLPLMSSALRSDRSNGSAPWQTAHVGVFTGKKITCGGLRRCCRKSSI